MHESLKLSASCLITLKEWNMSANKPVLHAVHIIIRKQWSDTEITSKTGYWNLQTWNLSKIDHFRTGYHFECEFSLKWAWTAHTYPNTPSPHPSYLYLYLNLVHACLVTWVVKHTGSCDLHVHNLQLIIIIIYVHTGGCSETLNMIIVFQKRTTVAPTNMPFNLKLYSTCQLSCIMCS